MPGEDRRSGGGDADCLLPQRGQSHHPSAGCGRLSPACSAQALVTLRGHISFLVAGASRAQPIPAGSLPPLCVLRVSLHILGGAILSQEQTQVPPCSQGPLSRDSPASCISKCSQAVPGAGAGTRADCRGGTKQRAAEPYGFITRSTSCGGFYQHLHRGQGASLGQPGHYSSFHIFGENCFLPGLEIKHD